MRFTDVFCFTAAAAFALSPASLQAQAPRQMEKLGRGVVAIHQPDGKVFVSWRLLATDPENVAFNVYRSTTVRDDDRRDFGQYAARPDQGGGEVKLNAEPIAAGTWFVDTSATLSRITQYKVRPVVDGKEGEPSGPFTIPASAEPLPYHSIPLQPVAGYTPNDASLGDLDGDGEYEIVLHQAGRGRDNSQMGITDPPILQAYKLDGTLLWTINLGQNVREGAHYTQFMVYDLDGDGRAEVACKTADGSIDGQGKVIGDASAVWVNPEGATSLVRRRNGEEARVSVAGLVLRGPEYLTIFDGRTGAALATTDYVPGRHPETNSPDSAQMQALWGDGNGNRIDRFLACVAYLDGERPSLVMCRGYYTRAVLAAWDWRDGKLSQRWVFDSEASDENKKYRGQGNHNLSVADVDGDGRDEIVYGAAVIDDDGRGLYSTGWGHGDAMHVSDFVPDNPGLEVFNIQERFAGEGMNMRDAKTGKPLFLIPSTKAADEGGDRGEGPGRGNAFNIDPRYPGAEAWAAGAGMNSMFNAKGEKIGEKPRGLPTNFAVWWDGDLLRELLDQNFILKWNWEKGALEPLLTAHACSSNNGTKATPALSADLWGDWREEVIWRTRDGKELRIYTSTIPTKHRLVTLMHDPQYRVAIAWQNVAYNQPPHPSFALDEALPLPARPKVRTVGK
jgi:rhamnogalacturonan endolyase